MKILENQLSLNLQLPLPIMAKEAKHACIKCTNCSKIFRIDKKQFINCSANPGNTFPRDTKFDNCEDYEFNILYRKNIQNSKIFNS